jgi:hypothetical protein
MDILVFSNNDPNIAASSNLRRNSMIARKVRKFPWSAFRGALRSARGPVKYGLDILCTALTSFRNHAEGFVRPYQGRLWNWFHFGGIVLFPFSRGTGQASTCLFRLVLFKHFHEVESSLFPNFLSLRGAMHLGNPVFDKGNTGDTVSEGLNTVFPLGQQRAEPGNDYATGEVLDHGEWAPRRFFKDAGDFEGRKIFRMLLPVHGQ